MSSLAFDLGSSGREMRADLAIAAVLMLFVVAFGLFLLLFPDRITRYVPERAVNSTTLVLRVIGVLTLIGVAATLLHSFKVL